MGLSPLGMTKGFTFNVFFFENLDYVIFHLSNEYKA